MEHFIKILGILAILGLVYIVMAIYKKLVKNSSNGVWRRLIPMWAVLIGMGLGLIFFESIPGIMPTTDLLTSIIAGGVAGWGTVGANQFAKLTFGDDKKNRFYIKAENVVVNKTKTEEATENVEQAEEEVVENDVE